ncbi:MAG: hypothetical protein AAFV07_03675, partial [Bacteroidota bacterium]
MQQINYFLPIQKRLLLWAGLLLMSGSLSAQVHVLNQGAQVRMDPGTHMTVSGNVHHLNAGHHPGWKLEGQLKVSGNWNSTFFSQPIRVSGNGNVLFDGNQAQWLDGFAPTHFSRIQVANPMGLYLDLDMEVGEELALTAGHIYTGNYALTLHNPTAF